MSRPLRNQRDTDFAHRGSKLKRASPRRAAAALARPRTRRKWPLLGLMLLLQSCSTYQPAPGPTGAWLDGTGSPVPADEMAMTPIPTPVDVAPAPRPPYRLQIGDTIDVHVQHGTGFRESDLIVGPDGEVGLPLLGLVKAEGKTVAEFGADLQSRLGELLMGSHVAVLLKKYRPATATVLGQVREPGAYPVEGSRKLVEIVASAGGFRHLERRDGLGGADLSRAFVSREERMVPVDFVALFERGDLRHNVSVHPGDFIYVPDIANREVYVIGYVNKPTAVPLLGTPLSVLGAIAHAGGPADLARIDNIAVVRDISKRPRLRIVNAETLLSGQEPDFELAAGDVIYVPRDDLRAAHPESILQSTSQALLLGFFASKE